MQFPQLNREGKKQSGLGAFYAKNGIQQGSSSPQRAVGGRPTMGMNAPQMGMGMGMGMGRPTGMPPMMPYGAAPIHPHMGGGGMLPHIGAPSAAGGMGGAMGGAVAPAMGANPVMGSMMNMQAQLMQKRRANMALKQRAVQQYREQQMGGGQGGEPMMGAKPYASGGRGDYSQAQRQQPQQGEGEGGMDPQPMIRQPEAPKDPRNEAFDMGKKMAQMEQFMQEAKAEKEEAKAEKEEAKQIAEEHEQEAKENPKSTKRGGEKKKEDDSPERNKDGNLEDELEPEDMTVLDRLEQEVREKIAEGSKALHELEMTDEELRLAADAAGKEEMREKFRDRLENQQRRGKGKLPLQPLWRHREDGNPKPPKERILKGKSLFRACAWGIVIMFVRPTLAIRKRKITYKEKEQAEFRRTLDAFNDACCLWWGAVIKIPVASLQEGNVPSLRPKKKGTFGKLTIPPGLLTALKVRVRGVVKALKSARLPPDYITSFLVTLLDDDNYFYSGFLFEQEVKAIDLNEFGGTRGMVRELDEKDDADVSIPCKKGQVVLGEKSVKRRKVDASRARLLLQNFVLIRVVLNKCVLTPWTARISRRPKGAQLKTHVDNLRVVATVMYLALCQCNPDLPDISPNLHERYKDKLDEANVGGDGDGDDQNKTAAAPAADPKAAAVAKAAKVVNSSRDDTDDDDDDDGDDVNAAARKGASVPEYKEGSMMYYLFGPRQISEAEGRMKGPEDLLREDLAFSVHGSYVPLQQTVDALIEEDEFFEVKAEIESWLPELAADLDEYTDRLLVHVLESRPNVLHDDFHTLVEGHEDAPEGDLSEEQAAEKLAAKLTARQEEKEAQEAKKKNKEGADGGEGGGENVSATEKPSVVKLDLKGAGLVPSTARTAQGQATSRTQQNPRRPSNSS